MRQTPKLASRQSTVNGRSPWGDYVDALDRFGEQVREVLGSPAQRRESPTRAHLPELP